MSEQPADPVADGQAWALRQETAFPEWVTRYGGGDPARWDFGLDSLNVLSYIVFDQFPTKEAIDHPDNAAFSEPAAWYLGEIVRRSDPKKLRWSRCDYGLYAGQYVIEPVARSQRGRRTEEPHAHLSVDYSTASLEAVEIFTVNTLAATQDLMLRAAVTAYVGECLLRTGGEKWMWDDHPDHLTNGFPVVQRSVTRVSPTHLIEFAWARQDGQTFARIHRAWIAESDDHHRRAPEHPRQREPTPGLDVMPEPRPILTWVSHAAARFPDWVARYGAGCRWDFSAESLDDLARVVLDHCPAGTSLIDVPDGGAFIGGVVWYFGETLHGAKPSRWSYNGSHALATGRGWDGHQVITNDEVFRNYPMSVFLVQELDSVTRPRRLWGPSEPETNPKRLRDMYESWATAAIRQRIEDSQKRREQTRNVGAVAGCARGAIPHWIQQFGSDVQWDFSVDSLEALEGLIRQVAAGPEELLEDKANADFVEGAAWYFGEVLGRADPDGTRWDHERRYHPEPHLAGPLTTFVAEHLATVYKGDGEILRRHYELAQRLKERRAQRDQQT